MLSEKARCKSQVCNLSKIRATLRYNEAIWSYIEAFKFICGRITLMSGRPVNKMSSYVKARLIGTKKVELMNVNRLSGIQIER